MVRRFKWSRFFFFLVITVLKPAVIPIAGVFSLLLFLNTFISAF